MPANAPIGAPQLLIISANFGALADQARAILSDDAIVLTADQSNIVASDMTSLYAYASNVATLAATIAFQDSDAAFQALSTATATGAAELANLRARVANINKMCAILGAGVTLGVSIGTGNAVAIVKNAVALKSVCA